MIIDNIMRTYLKIENLSNGKIDISAANKKALEELERQARFTIQHLKHKQRILTNLRSKNNDNEIQ